MTNLKQFNPRVYVVVALGCGAFAGANVNSIVCYALRGDAPHLWEHLLFGLVFALVSLGNLWRAWPTIPKSHLWANPGDIHAK